VRRPYYLIRRGEYWYYRLNRESGLVESDGVTWHTTGCKDRRDAENFVKDLLSADRYPDVPAKHLSFRKYAASLYNWERCPHIRRLREEGKSITRRHARIRRQRLKKHILKDPFARKRLSEIIRADLLGLRFSLPNRRVTATVKKDITRRKLVPNRKSSHNL